MTDGSTSHAQPPGDADVDRMRRQFMLAREQLASHSLERYLAVRKMRLPESTIPTGRRLPHPIDLDA